MLRYDFNTHQEYYALCNYLETHGYTQNKAPALSGVWGNWHMRINTESKIYYETAITHIGSTIQCKNFTEVFLRLEYEITDADFKLNWDGIEGYWVYTSIGVAVLDNRRILMAKF